MESLLRREGQVLQVSVLGVQGRIEPAGRRIKQVSAYHERGERQPGSMLIQESGEFRRVPQAVG